MCGLAAEADAIGAQFGLTTRDSCLPETLPHKTRQNRGLRQTHTAHPISAPWRAAHIGKRRAVTGAGAIGEQVANKWSERATCRGYDSCCTVLLLYCSLLHYKSVMSGFLSTCVGLLSNGVGLLSNGVGLFSGEMVLENTPTPLFGQPLKFIAHECILKSLQYMDSWSSGVLGHVNLLCISSAILKCCVIPYYCGWISPAIVTIMVYAVYSLCL